MSLNIYIPTFETNIYFHNFYNFASILLEMKNRENIMYLLYRFTKIIIIVTKLSLQSLYANMRLEFIISDANVVHIFNRKQ